jgi:hypothetical protein
MPQAERGRYLRQLGGNGTIYGWTRLLANRRDMVEIEAEVAETRFEATREQHNQRIAALKDPEIRSKAKARLENITKLAKELSILENELAAAEDTDRAEAVQAITGEPPVQFIDQEKKIINVEAMEEERKGKLLGENAEYQGILAMKDKADIITYLAVNFGEKADARQSLENLRYIALNKFKVRLFEKA